MIRFGVSSSTCTSGGVKSASSSPSQVAFAFGKRERAKSQSSSVACRSRRSDSENSDVFDLRRAERARATQADSVDDYESRLSGRIRSRTSSVVSPGPPPYLDDEEEDAGENRGLLRKMEKAWRIFFPKRKKSLANMSAREAGKSRLRMILVADRNSLSTEVMEDMKMNIVQALEDYVDINSQQDINLSMTSDGGDGTVYSVSVPVRCVKPNKRSYFSPDGIVDEGDDTLMTQDNWDEWDENPRSRFPWGT